ncbi:MAG: tRNA (N(6)-L-threonylcarbamoyladenosine(37)-C(2))-methylthiotransferase MtaB [Candidatus Omnitrophota bacterium]
MRTVKFYTLGCKVNQYDTQEIRERFLEEGFIEAKCNQPADIYVVNTCTVTAKADKDSFYYIHRSYRENPKGKIIVTGCLAEMGRKKIKSQAGVCLVIPNIDKAKIVSRFIGRLGRERFQTVPYSGRLKHGISFFEGHTRAFLKIQDGCDNFCAYCRVPLARGVSRSKPLSGIISEARELAGKGFKEIVLTGICLGAYGRDLEPRKSLVDVITALEGINGICRIRLSSIEAKDVSEELINKIAGSSRLCRHLHIPIQSGDNKILKEMRRKYSREDYLRLVKKIKKRVPFAAITTDVLVGFPGEEEDNFRNTLDLVKKIAPLRAHIFPFSPRPGTAAFNCKEKTSECVIKERVERLRLLSEQCFLSYCVKSLGRKFPVLVERRWPEKSVFWEGYTDTYIKVLVKSRKNLKNQLICVKLQEIVKGNMFGKILR